MNDRIRQLTKQAGLYAFVSDAGVDPDIEKFAELIVRDCAKQVDDYYCDFYSRTAAEAIKEHFGVEE